MKNSKIVAAMSAAAMAVSMMAMPASAMTIPVPAGEEFNFTLNTYFNNHNRTLFH